MKIVDVSTLIAYNEAVKIAANDMLEDRDKWKLINTNGTPVDTPDVSSDFGSAIEKFIESLKKHVSDGNTDDLHESVFEQLTSSSFWADGLLIPSEFTLDKSLGKIDAIMYNNMYHVAILINRLSHTYRCIGYKGIIDHSDLGTCTAFSDGINVLAYLDKTSIVFSGHSGDIYLVPEVGCVHKDAIHEPRYHMYINSQYGIMNRSTTNTSLCGNYTTKTNLLT
jgi:hypothetical protein